MKVFILYSIALLTFWDLRNANTNQQLQAQTHSADWR